MDNMEEDKLQLSEIDAYYSELKERFYESYYDAVSSIIKVLNKSGINCEDFELKQKIREFIIRDLDIDTGDFDIDFLNMSEESFIDFLYEEDEKDEDSYLTNFLNEDGYFEVCAINFLIKEYRKMGYQVNYSPTFRYKPYDYLENLNDYDLPEDVFMSLWEAQRIYDFRIQINRETPAIAKQYQQAMQILSRFQKKSPELL